MSIYYVAAIVLLLKVQRHKWDCCFEKIMVWCDCRGRTMAAFHKEPYLDHYEVIISYYITLSQGSLEKKNRLSYTIMSSLSLKSWIVIFQGYLSNPIEGTQCKEYYIWDRPGFYFALNHFREILERRVIHWIQDLSSYRRIMGLALGGTIVEAEMKHV